MKKFFIVMFSCLIFLTLGFSAGQLNVTLVTPTPSGSQNVTQNATVTVNASIKCLADDCGVVMGSLRYNQSGTEPNQLVNISEPEKPFYKMNTTKTSTYDYLGMTQPSKRQWASNQNEDSILMDDGPNLTGETEISTADYQLINASNNGWLEQTGGNGEWPTQKYNFTTKELTGNIKNMTFTWEGYAVESPPSNDTSTIYVWNYTSSWWRSMTSHDIGEDVTLTVIYTLQSQFNSVLSAERTYFAVQSEGGGPISNSLLYTDFAKLDITAIQNTTQGCGNMYQNDICYLAWTINATGDEWTIWYLDANFSGTDTTEENNTLNFQINISAPTPPDPGSLNVTLMTPTVSSTNVTQNTAFNVSANISCGGGTTGCGNVNGTIFYNLTNNNYPDMELNGTAAEKPFYNFTNPVNFSCGSMSSDSYCYVSWKVNASGALWSSWYLNVTAKSSDSNVNQNSTSPNFQINISTTGGNGAGYSTVVVVTPGFNFFIVLVLFLLSLIIFLFFLNKKLI